LWSVHIVRSIVAFVLLLLLSSCCYLFTVLHSCLLFYTKRVLTTPTPSQPCPPVTDLFLNSVVLMVDFPICPKNSCCTTIPHHNRFTALFPEPPGWAGARGELLDFMVQGEINRGRHTDHPAGRHSIPTNQCPPPPHPPYFFTGRMPFLQPNQQCQSTEGN